MLDYKTLAQQILDKKAVTEEMPFGPDAKVFKVVGKMFALVAWEENPLKITVKCDPNDALAWRARYPAVRPGYYMNKEHWNTITLDGSISDEEILNMIEDSYRLVVSGLKKSEREKLNPDS